MARPLNRTYWFLFYHLSLAAIPVHAELTLYENNEWLINAELNISTGYFYTENTNFGVGRIDASTGQQTGDAKWYEASFEPGINIEFETQKSGILYSGISTVGALTGGDGDAAGLTAQEEDLDLEQLYFGWHSAHLFANTPGIDKLSISFGRQDFQIGDGFLIYDGSLDIFDDGAYWLTPRSVFKRAGLIQIESGSVHTDLFYLKSNKHQDNTELVGINIETIKKSIGAAYMHILDSNPSVFAIRDGMDIWTVRANQISHPKFPQFSLWGQYVRQTGSGSDGEFDANAWYAEGQYLFSNASWSPAISYRYSFFSGDDDISDNNRKDFDTLFYGFSRGWGTWFQGEITGEYLLFNSNQTTHMLHLSAYPMNKIKIGAIYYRFLLDEKNYFGTNVNSDEFADELNLYTDWSINEHTSISAVYAYANPDDAAEQAFGDNQDYHLFEIALFISF